MHFNNALNRINDLELRIDELHDIIHTFKADMFILQEFIHNQEDTPK